MLDFIKGGLNINKNKMNRHLKGYSRSKITFSWDKALELNPKNQHFLYWTVNLLKELGKFDESKL